MSDQIITPLDLLQIIAKKNELIEYMRNTVKAYADTYQRIGLELKELGEDDEPSDQMEDDMELCFDQIQPLLTLYEDTKPENIESTLAGHSSSSLHKVIKTQLN